jgi:hypothetical protein
LEHKLTWEGWGFGLQLVDPGHTDKCGRTNVCVRAHAFACTKEGCILCSQGTLSSGKSE